MKGKVLLIAIFLLMLLFPTVLSQGEGEDYCIGDTPCINLINEEIEQQSSEERTEITLFYSTSCPHCEKVEAHIEKVQSEEGELFIVNKIKAVEDGELFMEYLQNYSVPQEDWGAVPILFVEGREQKGGTLSEVSLGGIITLALADAVNPCALAVLLILLTAILTKYPKKKNKALLAGILFSLAILICYFTLGMLIVLGFKSVASISSVETGMIYKLLGALAILIGLFNIKDWFSYGAGGFVIEVPLGWRPKMKKFIHSVTSPAGAFLIGIIVSLFLLPCTSGPYFVAGGLLGSVEWSSALLWLLLYNLIFIVPMIGITLFIYGGFTSVEEISGWRERNIEKLHLVTGIILVLLGIYVLSVGFGIL